MNALMQCDLLDASGAMQTFSGREEFWVALTELHGNSKRYLRAYTPSVIVYGDEVRQHFLNELHEVEKLVTSLRVKRIPEILETIVEAIDRQDESTLADLLRVFYAEMDILRQGIEASQTPDRAAPAIPHDEKKVIMIVDDVPDLLTATAEMLLEKYRVIALPNAQLAMNALERQIPNLFILDIEMPEINGYELAKYIRSLDRFKQTPILFLSGKGTRGHVVAAMLHGGNDYLLKPIGKSELLKKVKQYIQ
jgi:CheY-like chemotaxis protein